MVWATGLVLLAYLTVVLVDWQALRDQPELERVTPADVRARMAEYDPPWMRPPPTSCHGNVEDAHPPGVVSRTAFWEDYSGAYEALRKTSDEELEALRERERRRRMECRWADQEPVAKYRALRSRLAKRGGNDEGVFADRLQSGGHGPAMVAVPAGAFLMGCPANAWCFGSARPFHEVRIPKPFALSMFEVTFEEWDACVTAGGCGGYRPRDHGWGRGARPALCLSWNDAQAYVRWLSVQTGAHYRLPSEAEWEYAARAGHGSCGPTGSGANCDGCGSVWAGRQTAPVGSFPPNAFGLHDMQGNVLEWLADCWNENCLGAPSDGSAWLAGDCSHRALRGSSWDWTLTDNWRRLRRPASQLSGGFRVARTLSP